MLAIGVPLVVGAGMMMVDDEGAENKKRETQLERMGEIESSWSATLGVISSSYKKGSKAFRK